MTVTDCMILGNSSHGGGGGGGIYINGGISTVTNSTISGNSSPFVGGGIRSLGGSVTVINSIISENSAFRGAGIHSGAELTIINSIIAENRAGLEGGGIYNWGSLIVTNCTISENSAKDFGGGIYNSNGDSTITLNNTIVAKNSDSDIYNRGTGTIFGHNTLTTFTAWTDGSENLVYDPDKPLFVDAENGDYRLAPGSQAIGKGNNDYVLPWLTTDFAGSDRIINGTVDIGAYEFNGILLLETPSIIVTTLDDIIDAYDGLISLREAILYAGEGGLGTTITFDESLFGQTIILNGSELYIGKDVTIDDTCMNITIDANQKSRAFNIAKSAEVVLVGLTITGGKADFGGGISNEGVLTVMSCVIADNAANYTGGGIFNENTGTLTLTNSLVVDNIATPFRYGGGIGNYGTMMMTNSTVAGNSGVGIYVFGGDVTINNSIIAENSLHDIYRFSLLGAATIQGNHNLTTFTDWSAGGNNFTIDAVKPLFEDSANGDYRLAQGSQAINMGNNQLAFATGLNENSLDVVGNARFSGKAIDIGAYEFELPVIQVSAVLTTTPEGAAVSDIHEWQTFMLDLWLDAEFTGEAEIVVAYDANLFVPTVAEKVADGITLTFGDAILNAETGLTEWMILVGIDETFMWPESSAFLGAIAFMPVTGGGVAAKDVWRNASENPWLTVDGENVLTNVWAVPYDLDDSGKIDIHDLILFIKDYGKQDGFFAADFTGDGKVNIIDLILFIEHYGKSVSSTGEILIPGMLLKPQFAPIAAAGEVIPAEFAAMFGMVTEPESHVEDVLEVQLESAFTLDTPPVALSMNANAEQDEYATPGDETAVIYFVVKAGGKEEPAVNVGSESASAVNAVNETKPVVVEKLSIYVPASQPTVLPEVSANEPVVVSPSQASEIATIAPTVQSMNNLRIVIHQPHPLRLPTAATTRDTHHDYWAGYDSLSQADASVALLPQGVQAASRQQKVLEFLFTEENVEEEFADETKFFQPVRSGLGRKQMSR